MTSSRGVACRLLEVARSDRLQNCQVSENTFASESTSEVVRDRRYRSFGHVCRMPSEDVSKEVKKTSKTTINKKTMNKMEWSSEA